MGGLAYSFRELDYGQHNKEHGGRQAGMALGQKPRALDPDLKEAGRKRKREAEALKPQYPLPGNPPPQQGYTSQFS